MVKNGEACPQCLTVYPAPTTHAETVTCGTCGFCYRAADTFKWKLFTEWHHATANIEYACVSGGGDHVKALYAAWLAGYQTGYDHAY